MNKEEKFYSTTEAAKILGVSRVTIFNRIKEGKIHAKKIGRNFIIRAEEIEPFIVRDKLTNKEKEQIGDAVHRAAKEYAEAFKLLGKE
jgi:excisionase family DNA binding protein